MNAHEHLLAAAAELQRDEHGNWPGTWRSPSQRRQQRPALEREAAITWVMPEAEARAMPWLRERFLATRPKRRDLIGYSTDARGRCIRSWFSRPEDQAAYQRLLRLGCGTAPLEAVHPASIEVGRPAMPAHPFLLPKMWQAIAASEGTPVELPAEAPDDVANAGQIMRSFWQGLAPDSPYSKRYCASYLYARGQAPDSL